MARGKKKSDTDQIKGILGQFAETDIDEALADLGFSRDDESPSTGERQLAVFPTEAVTEFLYEGSQATIEFDWQGLGSPRELTLEVGGKVIAIPLPSGFPAEPLSLDSVEIDNLGQTQVLGISSQPDRVTSNVLLTLSLEGLSTAFVLRAGSERLLGGLWLDLNGRRQVVRHKGRILWEIVHQELSEAERHVRRGGRCEPDCIWYSILSAKRIHPWKLDSTRITPDFLIQTYRRKAVDLWVSYHCEGGVWVYKHSNRRKYTETQVVRLKRH